MTVFWLLLALILLGIALDRLIERMYRYEKQPHRYTPQKYQIPFEEVYFPATGGGQLYGWWIPSSASAPTLVLIHGWGRNLARVMPYIRALHPMGYNLLAFDARNHGSSSPIKHPTVGTFSEDALAAVDFVAGGNRTTSGSIGLIGLSVGGGAAINVAGWDERIQCVITIGAISHPVAVMNHEFRKRRVPAFVAAIILGYMRYRFGLDFDQIAPVNNIAKARADILLIHGENDETVPLAQAQALKAAGKAGKTRLWIIPGKGHSDCHTHPEFWGEVTRFLQGSLPASWTPTSANNSIRSRHL